MLKLQRNDLTPLTEIAACEGFSDLIDKTGLNVDESWFYRCTKF